jgi:pSer/pThr/pTyr-binding forkhead associated (FHA) protein
VDEGGHHFHISGEHFAVECVGGRFFLIDRGSASGTVVAGTRVGDDREGGRIELRDGDQVVVGTRRAPYIFQFSVVSVES